MDLYGGNYRVLWHIVINSFIELEGKWRLAEDPEWREILARLHMSLSTEKDIRIIINTWFISSL
jgi:hypothetical protein